MRTSNTGLIRVTEGTIRIMESQVQKESSWVVHSHARTPILIFRKLGELQAE